ARLSGAGVLSQAGLCHHGPRCRLPLGIPEPDDGEAVGKLAGQSVPASIPIRAALPGEAPGLSRLCVRSKAHWGYDDAFLEEPRPSLTFDPAAIDAGRVFVAIDAHGGPLGGPLCGPLGDPLGVVDCCPLPEPGAFDLVHLFV